jgi:hypothetical protein
VIKETPEGIPIVAKMVMIIVAKFAVLDEIAGTSVGVCAPSEFPTVLIAYLTPEMIGGIRRSTTIATNAIIIAYSTFDCPFGFPRGILMGHLILL